MAENPRVVPAGVPYVAQCEVCGREDERPTLPADTIYGDDRVRVMQELHREGWKLGVGQARCPVCAAIEHRQANPGDRFGSLAHELAVPPIHAGGSLRKELVAMNCANDRQLRVEAKRRRAEPQLDLFGVPLPEMGMR